MEIILKEDIVNLGYKNDMMYRSCPLRKAVQTPCLFPRTLNRLPPAGSRAPSGPLS